MTRAPGGRLRIGLLHQYRLGTSGSGIYLTRLVEQLVRQGHEVTVLSHDDAAAAVLPPSCRTVSLRGAGTPVAYPRAEEPGSTLFRDLSDTTLNTYLDHAVDVVSAVVRRHDLQVLHVNSEVPMSYVASQVQERCGTPYVVVGHGSTMEYVVRADQRYLPLCRTGFLHASAIVALNDDVRRRMIAVDPRLEPKLVQIPAAVDCDLFRPLPSPTSGPPVVTYVGRLSMEKGVFHLIGSLAELRREVPDVRVRVVGDGVERPLLEQMHRALVDGDLDEATRVLFSAADLSEAMWVDMLARHWRAAPLPEGLPPVEFLGHLPPREVAAELAAADVVVVPSLVREAFPLVVLESLACGTPPVCADSGGLSAVLAELRPNLGEIGERIALPGSAAEMSQQLAPILGDLLRWLAVGERRAEAREQCRSLAKASYDWTQVGARLAGLYAEASRTASSRAAVAQ